MLRLRVLVSVVPLAVASFPAGGELSADSRPSIAVADMPVQPAALSWQSSRHVSFTDNPATSMLDAAALIVGAHGGRLRNRSASR